MVRYKFSFLILLLMTVLLITACRGSAQNTPTPNTPPIDIAVEVLPDPPSVGDAVLRVTLTTSDGTPINDATVAIKGDMNHAGMAPVIGAAQGTAADGRYEVPFEWTMGGDWNITVTVVLADGSTVNKSFDMSVSSERSAADEEDFAVGLGMDDLMNMGEATEESSGDCSLPPTLEPGATREPDTGSCALILPTLEGESTEEAP